MCRLHYRVSVYQTHDIYFIVIDLSLYWAVRLRLRPIILSYRLQCPKQSGEGYLHILARIMPPKSIHPEATGCNVNR